VGMCCSVVLMSVSVVERMKPAVSHLSDLFSGDKN